MSDVLSFAEIDGQHVELLPERSVMSTLWATSHGSSGGNGGAGQGGIGAAVLGQAAVLGTASQSLGNGAGGAGGSVNG